MKKKVVIRYFSRLCMCGLFVSAFLHCATPPRQADTQAKEPVENPNILFIAVDDLRPELNCYGKSYIHSPAIDRLAREGVLFSRAYCNVPVCGASRASLLTGARPTRHRFIRYDTWAEKDYPEAITLPENFRNNGYYTISNGKIFHHQEDSQQSWDELWFPTSATGQLSDYVTPENIALVANGMRGYPYERAEADDSAYFDGKLANKAIEDLRKLKNSDKPFFLALGFFKPHLPFNAPAKYWDLYDRQQIALPETYQDSSDAPDAAFHNFGELRNYQGVPAAGPVSDSMAISLIHGYYASLSYMDAQLGRVLATLEELGLKENTIVILWGDHGYNLGEHGLWCKHCNFNTALQSPLLMSGPGLPKGKKLYQLVEFVDIFPTLNEMAGLPALPEQLEGRSMVPLLQNSASPWKEQVISKFHDGVSIKTNRYIYTEWSKSDTTVYARMLFDHERDPQEMQNIAAYPQHQGLVQELQQKLRANWGRDFNKKTASEQPE